ncbi:endo-1,3-beta glucanase [Recurvomyces mirabilis]|nr:endo-1,3-beta glucanase [Recurvomyces mirabilis]
MDRQRFRPRSSHLLPLIACLQVQPHWQNASSITSSDSQQTPPYGRGAGNAAANTPATTCTEDAPWRSNHPVQQIQDGQIQEIVYTEVFSSQSGTETLYSTTTATTVVTVGNWPTNAAWGHGPPGWQGDLPSGGDTSTPTNSSPPASSLSSSISTSAPTSSPSATTSTSPVFSAAAVSSTSQSSSSTSSVSQTPSTSVSTSASLAAQSPAASSPVATSTSSSTAAPQAPTSVPDSSLTSLTTSEVQSATVTLNRTTLTSVITTLATVGNPSSQPFQTSIANATSTLSLINTSTLSSLGPTATANVTAINANDIFQAIATDAPPSQISSRADHPVPTLGIQQQQEKLETNKFYANFFLGDQAAGTWTHPYSVSWSKGAGETKSWGLAISHIERTQLAEGSKDPSKDAGDASFFAGPIGLQSIVLSATELAGNTQLTTDTLTGFSANVNLLANSGASPAITFPLVQGMAFVTGLYSDVTPLLESGSVIQTLTYVGTVTNGQTYKYRAALNDGFNWVIYITPSVSGYQTTSFTLLSSGEIQGPSGFAGSIQVAKVPGGSQDAESVYDASAGAYPTGASISGSVQGTAGSYTLSWSKGGISSQKLLMFALPHHLETLSFGSGAGKTDVQLWTTTKGLATAITGDSWTLDEATLPIDMSFAPWSPQQGSIEAVSGQAEDAINAAAYAELNQDISKQTNSGSLYYDGKALAKFAAICYTANDIAKNKTLAATGRQLLETAFALHVDNQMPTPLVYDTRWGGAVSSGSYGNGNSGVDFGNTYYNDHHFHYGYFVYAAAVIGYLRPAWLNEGTNKAWVNMLVRDYANSVNNDPYFPFQRMFDWYHGHSWAHGVIETADGKDQESSSEDTMASYGMKMWGQIIGDTNMEARGNLMLAVQARSLQHYYLLANDNTVQPSNYIGNKAGGIMFENKMDHTTYFGTEPEYIEGIHMLPLMPFSTLSRTQTFVQQEWNAYFGSSGIKPATSVTGGWRGILVANQAIFDAKTAYSFFSSSTFDISFLDNGASQTWYLAWSAALGGSTASKKVKRSAEMNVEAHLERKGEIVSHKLGNEDGYIGATPTRRSGRSSRLRQRMSG